MSTDSLERNSGENGFLVVLPSGQDGGSGDVDDTPRSEAPPPLLDVTTPRTTEAAVAKSIDYFSQSSAVAAGNQPPHGDSAEVAVGDCTATNAQEANKAQGHTHPPPGSVSTPDALLSPRPAAQHTPSSQSIDSVESVDSVATLKAARPILQPSGSSFPDQSFAALHSQYHGTYYRPSHMRKPLPPVPYSPVANFATAIASHHPRAGQSAPGSPAGGPNYGLFSPSSMTAVRSDTSSATYPSPFLHHTQRHVPKETHIADVDVDPISGRKVINHYEIMDELGRGTHGKVKLGRDLHHDNVYVAIKIVERFSKRRKLGRLGTTEDKVKKEVAILKKARHPNVVALLEVIDDPSRKKVYIVLEWVEKGEINWRRKAPREIAMVEARRYERESREAKTGKHDERLAAQDRAVLEEAKKRLDKQKRRQIRTYRRMRRGVDEAPEVWSNEMAGEDDMSEESEEDRLSRISSITGEMSVPLAQQATQWLDIGAGRRISRTPSPLVPTLDTTPARPSRFLRLTAEPENPSPTTEPLNIPRNVDFNLTGLEGTMYGAYDPNSDPNSTESSLPSSLQGSQHGSVEGLSELAHEVLDSHLDSELEYVPIMSMNEIRGAFRDTVLGLQYLHYQGIIHRDIKPPNLLATHDNHVKISDFGVSYLGRPIHNGEGEDVSETEALDLDDEAKELAKTVGTPAFYAPELCTIDPTDEPLPVTNAIDIWALGITLFCMLFARTPFVESEYVVMRSIAEEKVYIPAQRLLPVDSRPKSRPSSHGRGISPQWARKRNELEFVYEDLGDDLLDLLHKLLIKDPRKRITLEEIRHHPWVLADIPNPLRWFDESDPRHHQEHQKIEISNEELKAAVVPLNLVERAKSVVKSMLGKGRDLVMPGGTGRARGKSNAGSPATSAHSSSSTISQDARRSSIFGSEELFVTALRTSHGDSHGEHPLSKSVAASPEQEHPEKLAPRLNGTSDSSGRRKRMIHRPSPPHRAMTITSNTPSMRTVTQSDYQRGVVSRSPPPPPSPGLPGTPQEVASPGGSSLGGLLGGPGRIIDRVRARSRQRSFDTRGLSSEGGSETGSVQSSDPHGEASVAISSATATGLVQQPDLLRGDFTPQSSAHNSPASSRSHSAASDYQYLQPTPGPLSRLGSNSSLTSAGRLEAYRKSPVSRPRQLNESTPEDWERAKVEQVRRRVNEHLQRQQAEMANAASSGTCGSPASTSNGTCPPSPDDHVKVRQESQVPSLTGASTPATPDEVLSPSGTADHLPPALASSSSDFGSAVSMSISNPSIPSAISEASSVDFGEADTNVGRKESSDDTLNSSGQYRHSDEHYDAGYSPDEEATINSDDDDFDSSSDSDGGLVMSRRRSAARAVPTSKARRGTGHSIRSKKSSRSGSSNTVRTRESMKKVRTRESSDEQTRVSLDIHEE